MKRLFATVREQKEDDEKDNNRPPGQTDWPRPLEYPAIDSLRVRLLQPEELPTASKR